MKTRSLLRLCAAALVCGATALHAQVPQLLNYQGRVVSNGTNFTGNGQFKFALVNAAATTTYWSNDGTSVAGSQPAAAVTLSVAGGLYSVLLGDTSLAGMTAIPTSVFANSDVRLRVWFNDGVTGSQLLAPDQRIAAVGYAMMGASVPDGAITTAKIADGAITSVKIANSTVATANLAPNSVNSSHIIDGQVATADLADGAVNSAKVLDGSLLGADLAANSVTSAQLADTIALGAAGVNGQLDVYSTAPGTPAISLVGSANRLSTYGDDGLEQIRLWGPSWGEILLYDGTTTNHQVASLTANNNGGGRLYLYAANGATTNSTGSLNVDLRGEFSTGNNSAWAGFKDAGSERVTIAARNGSTGVGGLIDVKNDNAQNTMRLIGDTGSGLGTMEFHNSSNLVAALDTLAFGSRLRTFNSAGAQTAIIGSSAAVGGFCELNNGSGTVGLRLDGDDGGGGLIVLRNAAGTATVTIDGDYSGDGRVITQELQITGGSDLSEQFDISAPESSLQPGMVVCIDPKNPGQLVLSTKAHDRAVAGIISGAGGVKPGMLMGQKGTAADGKHPVALTGRVYCWADASQGAIEPGDLLTTSDLPGHAMKVSDHAKAQGAILGKAMTGLAEGKGMVLVLVTLQ